MVICPHCEREIDVPEIIDTSDVVFILTKEDVLGEADEMGIPQESITDDMIAQVRKGVDWGLGCWPEVVKDAINMALKG